MKNEGVGLIVRTISFQDFQPMCSWSGNVTDRQTDRQTTCNLNTTIYTIDYSASRGKNEPTKICLLVCGVNYKLKLN